MDELKSPIRMTPAFFYLMLAIAEGSRHGHAMARAVEQRSGGSVKLGPGSLYWSIGRLAEVGMIEEVDAPEDETDQRRRYYALTSYGRDILSREMATLERIVDYARAQRIV